MAILSKKRSKSTTKAYLTKRATANAAKKGLEEAAIETMNVMGYNVVAKDGWVVQVDSEGRVIKKISKVAARKKTGKINLD